ncbi:hypothetical protein [Magnetospirillum molischianum]
MPLGPAGEGDPDPRRQQQLGVGAVAGGDKVPAVDHRDGEGAMVDHRADARPPGRTGNRLVAVGGGVAEELEGVATLDQPEALFDQPLQFDRAHLRAVLFQPGAVLRLFIGVEIALEPVDLAVEDGDE